MLDITSDMRYADGDGLRDFALVHRLAHNDLASAIGSQFSIATPNFDVGDELAHSEWELLMLHADGGPKEPGPHLREWLMWHEELHKAEYTAAGLGELPDLSDVNFYNRGEFDTWMYEHRAIHDAVAQQLGIASNA